MLDPNIIRVLKGTVVKGDVVKGGMVGVVVGSGTPVLGRTCLARTHRNGRSFRGRHVARADTRGSPSSGGGRGRWWILFSGGREPKLGSRDPASVPEGYIHLIHLSSPAYGPFRPLLPLPTRERSEICATSDTGNCRRTCRPGPRNQY